MAILTSKKESDKEPKAVKQSADSAAVVYSTSAQKVLAGPRVSEKAGHLSSAHKYVFNVAASANKVEVKKAVEHTYKVVVVKVNMIKVEGKSRSFGRTKGKTRNFKKAVVTLKPGQSIEKL